MPIACTHTILYTITKQVPQRSRRLAWKSEIAQIKGTEEGGKKKVKIKYGYRRCMQLCCERGSGALWVRMCEHQCINLHLSEWADTRCHKTLTLGVTEQVAATWKTANTHRPRPWCCPGGPTWRRRRGSRRPGSSRPGWLGRSCGCAYGTHLGDPGPPQPETPPPRTWSHTPPRTDGSTCLPAAGREEGRWRERDTAAAWAKNTDE